MPANIVINWVDFSIIVILAWTTIRGLLRGFIRSVFDILAFAVAIFLAYFWFNDFSVFISNYVKMPANIVLILSFVAVWTGVYAAISLVGLLIHKILGRGFLGPINALGGAVLGASKGLLIIWLVLQVITMVPLPDQISTTLNDSSALKTVKPIIETSSCLISGFLNNKPTDFQGKIKENKVPENKTKDLGL